MKISGATAPVALGWIFMVATAATTNNSDRIGKDSGMAKKWEEV